MLNLLKSDFYKLKQSKAFWILMAVAVVFSVIGIVAMNLTPSLATNSAVPSATQDQLASMLSYNTGVGALVQGVAPIAMLMAIFVAIFLTAEFTHGTMKNTLSKGSVRIKVYFSKLITCGFVCLVMLLVSWIIVLIIGTILWGFNPQGIGAWTVIAYLLLILLLTLAYTAVFTFVAMSIRSNGGTVAINVIVSVMMSTLLGLVDRIIGHNVDLTKYWLDGPISSLSYTSTSGDVVQAIVVAAVWGVVAIVVGIVLFQKRDVK
jgi:ABC-2 type transport system permease protein